MRECKIITFTNTQLQARKLKRITDVNGYSVVEMMDYPSVEQEINAYLTAGFTITNISNTYQHEMTVVLTR